MNIVQLAQYYQILYNCIFTLVLSTLNDYLTQPQKENKKNQNEVGSCHFMP